MSKVELISKTTGVGKYENLSSEEIIAAIARHGIIKEDEGKLVKYLMDKKHWSPLDMINFGFEIETSRAIGRQMLRHWSLKPSELSQRYSSDVSFESIELRREHPVNRQSSTEVFNPEIIYLDGIYHTDAMSLINNFLHRVEEFYQKLLEAGVAKECARMILPECTTTIITFNGTLRSWLSFLNVRIEEHSQKEIREIAVCIGEILEKELPNVFVEINWRNGLFM